ncbi:hypothetical protein CSB11_00085 [Candidatus Campbellbacteria bacterium]|nr:MAG: hypothetical protein CSB11_00085 [Candidatus Campbellbacteria bacterium]
MIKNKKTKKEKGFTLVEALISITILMVSIAAPLSVASSSLIAAKVAEKQIIAAYLAQDALEYVINIKAGNKISNYTNGTEELLHNINICSNHGCFVNTLNAPDDPTNRGISEYTTADGYKSKKLYLQNSGIYSYNTSGTETIFSRVVKINRLEDKDGNESEYEAKVEVTVYWTSDRGDEKSYTLSANLTKW